MIVKTSEVMLVSERDFYKEIETSDDVKYSNLKNDIKVEAENSDIIMYISNGNTIILKNRYGSDGVVV